LQAGLHHYFPPVIRTKSLRTCTRGAQALAARRNPI
jgi:hypothetical protein